MKIDINFKKTCECKDNHLNCLTAKEWIKSQLGVWQFNYQKEDIRDKELHPATYPLSLAEKIIKLFTHEGELVLDPFNGSGTTLLAAKNLNRNAVGFDISKTYCKLSDKRLSQGNLLNGAKQITICDDARNISKYLDKNSVKLSVTSPPYANLLNRQRKNKSRRGEDRKNGQYMKVEQYSQKKNDLGTLDVTDYEDAMYQIYKGILPVMKPGAHAVVNIADMWWEGQRVPLHMSIIKALVKAGYIFKNTIIWDRTNIVNRIGIFGWPSNYITMGTTFEYILDFYKPKDD
jgi:DNA modification methylase